MIQYPTITLCNYEARMMNMITDNIMHHLPLPAMHCSEVETQVTTLRSGAVPCRLCKVIRTL